jgi:mannosyltransferase OCH1-like enzyme
MSRSEIHKLITYIWNKEEFPQQWKESIILHMHVGAAVAQAV